jgi:hypothetical protein
MKSFQKSWPWRKDTARYQGAATSVKARRLVAHGILAISRSLLVKIR